MHASSHACMHVRVHVRMNACVDVSMGAPMHVFMCALLPHLIKYEQTKTTRSDARLLAVPVKLYDANKTKKDLSTQLRANPSH